MSTRNLTMVILDGKYKVSQYGQYDGYPSHTGLNILKFLRLVNLDKFKEKLTKLEYLVSDEEYDIYVKRYNKDKIEFPIGLNRTLGYKVLEHINDDTIELIILDLEFASYSLHCEYGYVIDLDNNQFEIYYGFNQTPLNENDRFFSLQTETHEFYPIKKVLSYDLNNLPSDKNFLEECEKIENE